ncbi:MAG: helicase-related protein [Pseudomonadota bacterium]
MSAATSPGDETVEAVLGPTNTGKTHYAIDRMLSHRSGIIGFPLRLLAREVYDRIVAMRGAPTVALLTGEEKITPPSAQYYLCTVEAMPLDWGADFVAVDEIQLCADPDRGYVFTDRLLRARGRKETLFLGADTMRGRISALMPKARITTRPRLSSLSYAGSKKISRLPARSAVVAFSTDQVYAIAELIRRQKGGAAVVMGALSPRTRNAHVALYQNGDVEHLVATDAIGMGLNLDLKHVAFAGLSKFDGRRTRGLTPAEIAQIAGRAGRHTADGSFGVTGDAPPLDDEFALNIVENRFEPVGALEWRNPVLEFGTVPALTASLERPAPHPGLRRARDADDLIALRTLWREPELQDMTRGGAAVRRLWDCCQIPDFRKSSQSEHAALVSKIYRFLVSAEGAIPSDWIAGEVAKLDRVDGNIDQLSRRLAYMRTWTYVANRGGWLAEAGEWRGKTRAVEDRLSDALHLALTREFVDRRTSVLMRRLKQKEALVANVSDTGEVTAEGEHLGRIDGFRFIADPGAGAEEQKRLRAASLGTLQGWFAHRADKFYNAPDTEIDVTEQGGLMWGEIAVGRLEPGADVLSPRVRAFIDEMLEPPVVEKIERRLSHWITRRIAALFEPLIALRDDEAITGLAKGVGFRLVEGLGVLERRPIADDVKALDQDARTSLRKHGVRFGQHSIFMTALLKPAPTRLRLVLWGLLEKLDEIPAAPPPGHVTILADESAPDGYFIRAGYRRAGARAIRIDMLERLADLLRDQNARAGFEAKPDMLSITGMTLDQFADLMQGLGFAAERAERPKVKAPPEPPKTEAPAASETADPSAEAETAAAETTEAETTEAETTEAESAAESATAPESDAASSAEAETQAAPAEATLEDAEGGAPEAAPAAEAAEETPTTGDDVAAETVAEAAAEVAEANASGEEATAPKAVDSETEAAADTAPDAQASEPAADAAPEMEVFYTFTIARRQQRGGQRGARGGSRTEQGGERKGGGEGRGGEGRGGEGRGGEGRGGEKRSGEHRGGKGKRPPKGAKGGGGGGKNRFQKDGERPPRTHSAKPKPRADKPVDPDSPFAILQRLKT